MELNKIYKHFLQKLAVLEARSENIRCIGSNNPIYYKKYLSEALLSDIWQLWCFTCRNIILSSCAGTFTRNGTRIAPRPGDNSWKRIGYESIQAIRSQGIKSGKIIISMRQEPTWGDQDRIIKIVNTLSPQNSSTLQTAFGLPLAGPKHLQLVRNACFHKNYENTNEVAVCKCV